MAAIFSSPTERMTMYIQADADPLHMLSLSLVAVGFGGAMVNDPQDAMVIIITNRNTALGKSLIANYSVCPTKEVIPVVVVDHKWLDACVQQRRIVSEYTDGGFCGGFYLPREGIVAESSVASFTHLPVTPLTLGDQTNDIGPRKEDDGPPLKTPISEGSANTAVPAKSFPSAMVPSAYLQQNLAFESNSASNHSGNDINLGTSVHQIAEESSSVISVVTDRIAAELADKAEKCRNQWAPYTRKEIMQLIFYLVDHPQEYGELRQNKIKVSFNKTEFWQGLNDITRSKRVPYSWSNYFSRHQAKLVKAIDAQLQLVADETPFDDGNHASEHAAGVPQETSSCEGEAFDFSVNDNVVTGDNENRDGQGCSVSQEVTATRMMGSDSKGDDYEAGGSLYALKPTVATYHHASHHLNDPSRTGMPNQRGRPFDSTEIQALVEYLVDHPEMCHGPQGAATGIRVNREHQWIKFSEGVGQGRSPESWGRHHYRNYVKLEEAARKLSQQRKVGIMNAEADDGMARSPRGITPASEHMHPVNDESRVDDLLTATAAFTPTTPPTSLGTPEGPAGYQWYHQAVGFVSYFNTRPSTTGNGSTSVTNLTSPPVSLSTPPRSLVVASDATPSTEVYSAPIVKLEVQDSPLPMDPGMVGPQVQALTSLPEVCQENVSRPIALPPTISGDSKRPAEEVIGHSSAELSTPSNSIHRQSIKRIRLRT